MTFLAIGLMLLGGGAMVAVYFALKKSGADYVAIADKYVAEGQYDKATEYYSKAVYRERTNAEWIDKWLAAMGKTTPSPRTVYLDRYGKDYLPALRAYADALPEDVGAQKRHLEEHYTRLRMSNVNEQQWDDFILMVEDAIKRFDRPDGPAAELLRYRGFANVFKVPLTTAAKARELLPLIEKDLTAALGANPGDGAVAGELAVVRMRRAAELRAAKDEAGAAALEKLASDDLHEFTEKNPTDSIAAWRRLQLDMLIAAQAAEQRGRPVTRGQLYLEKHPDFAKVMELLRNEPAEKLDVLVLSQFCSEAARSEKIHNAGVIELLTTLEAKHPQNMAIKMLIGRYEVASQHYDKAVGAYQRVIDAGDLPLSFEGAMMFEQRAEAYRQQILAKLTERESILQPQSGLPTGTPEDAAKLLADAKAIRGKLSDYVGETERVLQYVDARIAYAEGNFEAARINLDRYNERAGNQDVGALVLFGQIMERVQNTGAAREAYQRVLTIDGDNVQALFGLLNLEQGERNLGSAIAYCEQLIKLFPNALELKERLTRLQELQQAMQQGAGTVKDVVVQATVTAQQMVSGVTPDYAGAAQVLRDALKRSGDLSLYPMLARVLQADGQTDAAIAVVTEGLSKAPGNPRLTSMLQALKINDPVEAAMLAIEQDETGTPFQKHVWRYLVYSQYGKAEEAAKEIDAAEKIDPEHAVVLELKFRAALTAKDMAEAKRIADLAASKNADYVNGLTYKSQLEVAENRLADAAVSLETALEKDRNSVPAWRQLGALRQAMGKSDLAATAYERALAIRPQDVEAIKGLIRAKATMGQRDEALAIARRSQETAARDMEFVDMWLGLEAAASAGDRGKAMELRQQLAKRYPENERNNVALVLLMMDAQRFADARAMIDQLRRNATDRPAYVELEIRWHTAQGNIKSAIDTFNQWVQTLPPEKNNEDPYIALAGIFTNYGRYDAAMHSLENGGRERQNPKTMGADRKLGELQFMTQRFVQAIETFDKVLKADPSDPEFRISGQIVEAYIRLGQLEEARKRIDALGASMNTNSRMLILKGETLAGLGQIEEASRTYDAAVAAAKDDPIGYIKRAEFLAKDPQRAGDAQQDLRQALVLNPRHLGARRILTELFLRSNENEKAIETMRAGLAADPDNDAMRMDLIGLHLRFKQDREAITLVDEVLNRRKEDPLWLFRGREVMYSLERFEDAANYAWRLWERKKDVDSALAYVDAAMKLKSPDFARVMQVIGTPELRADQDLRLLIARARTQLKRQRNTEGMRDLESAIKLIDQSNLSHARAIMSGLTVVFEDPKERLKALTTLRPANGYQSWMAFLYSNLKTSIPETMNEGMAELKTVAEGANGDLQMRMQAYGVLGSRERSQKKYEAAINWWKDGLKLDPANAELNNNIAYCLAEDLHKPEEGLPFATKASQVAPNNPSVQDTLGTIYLKLKQLDKADAALARAMSVASTADEAVAVLLHLAEVRLLQGRGEEGAALVRRAEQMMGANAQLQEYYAPLLTELKGKIAAK